MVRNLGRWSKLGVSGSSHAIIWPPFDYRTRQLVLHLPIVLVGFEIPMPAGELVGGQAEPLESSGSPTATTSGA